MTAPLYNLQLSPGDFPRFVVFVFAGGFISWLGGRQRRDEESLLRAREELEAKVQSRTVDLRVANEKLQAEVAQRIQQKARAEARTASVMRANRTIPASLSTLGETRDLDQLLGEVLTIIVEHLGEAGGGVWLYDAGRGSLRLHLTLEDGEIKPARESDHPDATRPDGHALEFTKGSATSLRPHFHDGAATILRPEDIASLPELAPYRDYLTSRGVRSLVGVPLLAADDFLGMIFVRSRRESGLGTDAVAFVQAIAIHASLALKMAQLAEVARQVVVAEERREAGARNVEALGRIANAGRETLQRLTEHPDDATFLGHVLAVSVTQLSAIGASVWLGDPGTGVCRKFIRYGPEYPHYSEEPAYRFHLEPADAAEAEAFRAVQGQIVTHHEADIATLSPYEPYRARMRELGIQTLIRVPLFCGKEIRGIFHLLCGGDRTLSSEEEGLAHTLANQVVLALELRSLSEKAQAAALADERNRMAADVHDTLAQSFAATLLHLRSMDLAGAAPDLVSHWKFAQATAAEGLSAARRTMNAMRTATPSDDRPLAERLAERVRQVAARVGAGTKVRLQVQGEPAPLPWATEDEIGTSRQRGALQCGTPRRGPRDLGEARLSGGKWIATAGARRWARI